MIALCLLPPAYAQQTAAPSAPEAAVTPVPTSTQDEIIVVAEREQGNQIDRRIYTVKDNARTQTSSAFDILSNVPTVTVTPTGRVQILGTPGVKILIDGKEVADPNTILRNLQGSQVSRVEVMSNPSAQFSATGTGGVINIILRKPDGVALRAIATLTASSFGGYDAKIGPAWSHGRWSATGSIGKGRNIVRTEIARERTNLVDPIGPETNFTETASARATAASLSGNLLVNFKPDDQQEWSLSLFGTDVDNLALGSSRLQSATQDVTQLSRNYITANGRNLSLDYRRKFGDRGKMLTLSASSSLGRLASNVTYTRVAGSDFQSTVENRDSVNGFRLDYSNPIDKDRRFTFGAAINRTDTRNRQIALGSNGLGGPALSQTSLIEGDFIDLAAYVTSQFPLLGWKVMPGIRVEQRRYTIEGAQFERADTDLFPSLHIEHRLGKSAKFGGSYSRRVGRPGISSLNPALSYSDPTTAISGNPLLKPELTDALEAKVEFRPGKHAAIITAYRRYTRNVWTDLTTLSSEGSYVTKPVNIGFRSRVGANLSLQGPVIRRLRYMASIDASSRKYGGVSGITSGDAQFEYSGSVQLQYRDGVEGKPGSDDVTANIRYNGPTNSLFTEVDGYATADISWTHTLSDRIASVLRVSDPFGGVAIRSRARSALVLSNQTTTPIGPRITFALTYRLGDH